MQVGTEANLHRPGNEPYLSARAFELLPLIYGEAGSLLVGFYTYFRWLDDAIDSPRLTKEERLDFLHNQQQLLTGQKNPNSTQPIELYFASLPLRSVGPKIEPQVREQAAYLCSSFQQDVDAYPLWARTRAEIYGYNQLVMVPCAEAVSLILNRKPIGVTDRFRLFVDEWNYVAALLHLEKDLQVDSIVKIGFTQAEKDTINAIPSPESRKEGILGVFDKTRFQTEAGTTMTELFSHSNALRELDIPFYQKELSYRYMHLRQPHRLPKKLADASNNLYP